MPVQRQYPGAIGSREFELHDGHAMLGQ